MGKRLINNINDKNKRDEFLNFLTDKIGLKGLSFLEELAKISEVYIFSGVVRNFFIRYNGDIRDLDIVVKAENDSLENLLSTLQYERNSFGGYKLIIDSLKVDLWRIENTWAYKTNKINIDLFNFYTLPNTAFFNFSAIIFHYNNKKFIYNQGFLKFLKTKKIDLVLAENPMPQLCIVNTLYYHHKFNLAISINLKKYCISYFFKYNEDDFNQVQLKHFKEIKYEYLYIKEFVKIFESQTK